MLYVQDQHANHNAIDLLLVGYLKKENNSHMLKKIGIVICLVGLGFNILCPSICAAKELSHKSNTHSCCTTQSSHSQSESHSHNCNLHQESLVPEAIHLPALDLYPLSSIAISLSIPHFFSFIPIPVPELSRPPSHLRFLKTIRIQC